MEIDDIGRHRLALESKRILGIIQIFNRLEKNPKDTKFLRGELEKIYSCTDDLVRALDGIELRMGKKLKHD